jgi:peptide/nickel transport system substrate-binding protein
MPQSSWLEIHPQFMNPNPAVVADVRFRRALMHAIDRRQMVETVQYGVVNVADSFLSPTDPLYEPTLGSAVRYEYSPQRAEALLAELGYQRGGDSMLRDSAGQPLTVEFRTEEAYDIHNKTIFPVIDFWRRAGINAEPALISLALAREREWLATYPAFMLRRQPNTMTSLYPRRGANAPVAENRFTGQNYARYQNPEFDTLIERYFTTIPTADRLEVARRLVHHVSDQLPIMGLFYDVQPYLVSNRVQGVRFRSAPNSLQTWNAHEWEVRS